MDQHTVLIADSCQEFCSQLRSTLRWVCHVQTCHSGRKALSLLSELHPDILVLDLMLPELDGISVLKALNASGTQPVIFATTCLVSDYIIEAAEKLKVDYLLVNPCDASATAARIQEQLGRLSAPRTGPEDLPSKVSGLLLMMGFSAKLHGFKYLQEAIAQILRCPDQSITKELYPAVAAVYETAGCHVERSIRGAILDAWNRRDDRIWQLYFPPDSCGNLPKPTNAAFITRIADGLRISLTIPSRLQFIGNPQEDSSPLADCLLK